VAIFSETYGLWQLTPEHGRPDRAVLGDGNGGTPNSEPHSAAGIVAVFLHYEAVYLRHSEFVSTRTAFDLQSAIMPTILTIEPNENIRRLIREVMERVGYRVAEAGNIREVVEQLILDEPAVIILDCLLGGQLRAGSAARVAYHASHQPHSRRDHNRRAGARHRPALETLRRIRVPAEAIRAARSGARGRHRACPHSSET
jgi:CheY-like chemotaxis protein